LATDLHDDNQPVIDKALAIVKRDQAYLSIVNVLPNIPYYMASGIPSITELEDHLEEESMRKLKALEAKIDIEETDFHLRHGSPKRQIVDLGKKINCDLIIIGSHGHHDFDKIVGSTANGVLHRAHCDVLVIKVDQPANTNET
jgi:universal stress protein A